MDTQRSENTSFLEPGLKHAIVIWWALLWRGLTLGFGFGFVIGFIEGFVGALAGVPTNMIQRLTIISGAIASLPVGIWVVRLVLRKNFGEFRIRLVRNA